mmetsp:Transcript_9175/g.22850  ORF Transcript_9175/g.22850 Transcript_9175/m.22850 type:complete len:81 (-) Transcript_9175:72-314(-)
MSQTRSFGASNLPITSIPSELGLMSEVSMVALFHTVSSHPIPTELGNQRKVSGLYMYSASLKESIPTELGNARDLEYFGG